MRRLAMVLLTLLAGAGGTWAALALADVQGDEIRLHPALGTLAGDRDGYTGDVAYNPFDDEYLTSWAADGLATDGDTEVFVRRIGAGGAPVGEPTAISTTGVDGVADSGGSVADPAVAADATTGNWFVAWTAPKSGVEVDGQLLGPTGAQIGGDIRLSSAVQSATVPDVAFDTISKEYLAVFEQSVSSDDQEIWGQRISATGTLIGAGFRLTTTGASDTDMLSASKPSVAYNATEDEYMVAYHKDITTTDAEVGVQRVKADGTLLGTNTRLVTTGTDNDGRGSFGAAIAWNPIVDDYVTAFESDPAPNAVGAPQVYVLRVTKGGAPNGSPIQVSASVGAAGSPDIAYAAQFSVGNYLVTWMDQPGGGKTNAYARRLTPTGATNGAAFPLARADAEGSDSYYPRVAARSGTLQWLTLWTSQCLAPGHAEPFARRVDANPATGTACGVSTTPSTTTPPATTPPGTTPPVATTPPATVTTPPPVKTTPAATPAPEALKASQVVTLPSAKRCVSRRSFRIRLRAPKGTTLASAKVTVNGKAVKTVKGSRLKAPVDLRGLPKGRITVTVTARTTDGRTVKQTRRYRTCATKKRA